MIKPVGIICPCEGEFKPYIGDFKEETKMNKAGLTFLQGTLANTAVVFVISGVCKVNAALAAQMLIDMYQVRMIINSGTAGGMASEVGLLDTVVSTEVCYHDVNIVNIVELYPFMNAEDPYFKADENLLKCAESVVEKGNFPQKIHFGRMATGEKFIVDKERKEINEAFAPLCADMETAAIAHVCYVNKVPFIAVRSITDTEEHSGVDNCEANFLAASELSKNFVLQMLQEI
ncbi:5'-methylthioadenosine/adenosylhomocysteine nucleosidase [Aminipila terrae]|uniref:adenosylhomocysteine nucleosidase n=1 Tax=Aminipila terrae TaxID=2697030 RepID=A0A6P1MDH6_9FIRM|nr:5'-methylthioadenosine/adenosylhomocysteine nucleosidase [Aminipila terrae]QHI72700.1 5'-methylthioadenosine/adenosylhomocysteine nucleosidase [Aminipila terrae]